MDIQEIRTRTVDQLRELVGQLKKEQFNLRFQAASGELENTSRFRQVRRTLARVATVQRERQNEGTK